MILVLLMREKLILFLKCHPQIIINLWRIARYLMVIWSWFVPLRKKTIIFNSFGGRSYSDSPKALFLEICSREEFNDWKLIWAFVDPEKYDIPRAEKVKIDTFRFFKALLYSHVWVGNADADRGIGLKLARTIRIETWHGTPLKKICGEENSDTFAVKPEDYKGPIDSETIRCAQSEYDREIFSRIFHSTKESFLLCDLPRNDELLSFTVEKINDIKNRMGINKNRQVILYTPTYREYLINDNSETYIAPPINLNKWKEQLGGNYVLLIRAHYAVSAALGINDDDFVKDVSDYPSLNELYAISDMMVSDYSSTFFDYSILDRPMFCFAYDLKEYEEKRGLYLNLKDALPCKIHENEDTLITDIISLDNKQASAATARFHNKYAPYAGYASKTIINELVTRLG